ncbi:hypothetical protein FOZ62_001855 [Perkinsus olseni]|uniref:Uncharacterized protein n=1 Tax=Perkinsus olseni TaxID=32597 RepID=A0A7J6QZQ2_PEROL|nr:hypothetical protein FOZ62_001855 [Perkinsus olseni]
MRFTYLSLLILLLVTRVATDGASLRVSAGPSPFSFPPNCTNTTKPKDFPFCATGELDLGLKWVVDFDTYFFDNYHPSESVLLGLNMTINKGIPESLEVRTGGCAVPFVVDLLPKWQPHLFEFGVRICTKGGGPGKYDPKTKSYSAQFNITGDSALYSNGVKSTWLVAPFEAVGKAWVKPHFDMGLDATVVNSGGDPNNLQVSLDFINTVATVDGSVMTWHLFNGMSFDMYSKPTGHHYVNKTFVDKIIQLQPPQ